ncbi:MAG: nucleotidyltransferase domain-containing protein [Brevibacterium sp.]
MSFLPEYREAQRGEDVARLRRALALRAMLASGMSQRQIAEELGISQPAVSQQIKFAPAVDQVHPELLLEAAVPILKKLAADHGYEHLAVFGSAARREARTDSDIDLIVDAPEGTSSFAFIRFKQLIEKVLGRGIDLVDYAGLKPGMDDDIRHEAVLL